MPKLIDRLLKSLAVDDPRALHHLLSEPLPPEDAEIEPMIQEIITKMSALDYWCVLRVGQQERADVFEFRAKYESGMHRQLARYAMATYVATELTVRATAIVVSGKDFPKSYQELEPVECAGIRFEFPHGAIVGGRCEAGARPRAPVAAVAGAVHEAQLGAIGGGVAADPECGEGCAGAVLACFVVAVF